MRPGLSEDGITLIELVIAILVISIGTLSVLRTLDQSRLELGGANARYLAQTVAANRAEELRAFGATVADALPATVQQGPYTWTIETSSKRTEAGLFEMDLVVSSPGQPGARLVTYTVWEVAR